MLSGGSVVSGSSIDGVELIAFLLASNHAVLHEEGCGALRELRRLCAAERRPDPLDVGAVVSVQGAQLSLRDRLAALGDIGAIALGEDDGP